MQFSTSPNQVPPNFNKIEKKQNWPQRFTSQVHQLFFTSAIVYALIIMFLSLLSLVGKISVDFTLIHGFGLNFAVFTNAFLGFLLTVIPKYNGTAEIKKKQYLKIFYAFQISVIITLFINAQIGKILVSISLLYVVYLFFTIIQNSKAMDKLDSVFINLILVLGGLLLFCEAIFDINLNVMTFYSYLLAMVYIVALRMIPAFYFSYTRIKPWERPKFIRPIVLVSLYLLGLAFQFELIIFAKFISFFAMIFFGYITFNLNFYKKTPAIMSILVLGMIWFEIGMISLFLEAFFETQSLKLSLHIFALGFVTTLLIGFGSRVTMGHAVPAQKIVADSFTKFLFVFTQLVLLARVLASSLLIANNEIYIYILHLSATLWLVLFVLWSLRYGKTLLRL